METYTLDASKESMGRIASRAAVLLMGKHRASFSHHTKTSVRVVVVESDRLVLTGRKWQEKRYYRHSGWIGHLKELSAAALRDRDSRRIVRQAVLGMLPKNRLRNDLIKNLTVYKGASPRA